MKKRIVFSPRTKGGTLDDDYSLYDNGEVVHEYDKHIYPGGYNLKDTLSVDDLSSGIKERLLNDASPENKEAVKRLLGL